MRSTLVATCWAGHVPGADSEFCLYAWNARTVDIRPDHFTLGVLVLYAKGAVTHWVDLIITDLALEALITARIAELETELGAPMGDLEVARRTVAHGHAAVPGSSSFTIIRLARVGARCRQT